LGSFEQSVRRALWQFAALCLIAIVALFGVVVCLWRASPTPYIVSGGAVVAVFALLAQSRHSSFCELLTPNTFATQEFVQALVKYRRFKAIGGRLSLALAVAGVVACAVGWLGH